MEIKRIGITGNIGSGKSLVCKIFNHLGINTFYSDEETKGLYLLPEIRKQIVDYFKDAQRCEEIRLYDWNTEQITKKQWLKFERNAHLNPYSQFGQGGQVRFYNSSDMQELKSEWTIEYYPLYRY